MQKDLSPTDQQQEAWLAAFPPVSTEAWQHKIQEDLKEADYDQRLVWRPPEGFAVQPFYRAEDLHTLSPGLLQATRRKKAVHNDWHIRQAPCLSRASPLNTRSR